MLTDVLYPGVDLLADLELSADLAHSNTMGAAHLLDQLCQLIHMRGADPGQWLAQLALDNEENPLVEPEQGKEGGCPISANMAKNWSIRHVGDTNRGPPCQLRWRI